jgi:hypothetical protein
MERTQKPRPGRERARPAGAKPAQDASDDAPDPGRSAEREAQDHVIDHAARGESWLQQIWRAVRASTGRPSRRS